MWLNGFVIYTLVLAGYCMYVPTHDYERRRRHASVTPTLPFPDQQWRDHVTYVCARALPPSHHALTRRECDTKADMLRYDMYPTYYVLCWRAIEAPRRPSPSERNPRYLCSSIYVPRRRSACNTYDALTSRRSP